MNGSNNIDYAALFDELFAADGRLSISRLYLLSDMPDVTRAIFDARWSTTPVERREKIARHMADISEENFTVDFAPFAPLFLQDPSEKVRLAALDLLWDTTDVSLVEPLIQKMEQDPHTRVRASAAATLGHFVLMAQWGEISADVEEPIVKALLAQLDDPHTDLLVRRAALESIASAPSRRVSELIDNSYHDPDPDMNRAAVFAMGRTADPRWIPFVNNELDSDDPEMRAEAARAAAGIGSSEFTDTLVDLAREDEDLEVQIAAIFALGQIGSELASRTLTMMSDDPEYEELHEAIDEALEEMTVMGLDLDFSLLEWEDDEDESEDEDDR